jgi:L-gulonolactone oxidase
MATDAEHHDAIDQLMQNPTSGAAGRRLLDLAAQDPQGAQQARERLQPEPPLLPLDVVNQPFRRHNLVMPYTPTQVAQPGTQDELAATIQAAATAWEPIKAIGDGYGFANTGFTKGCLIPTVGKLSRILPIDKNVLKEPAAADSLFRFEAGATIEIITTELWARGKAVLNQPGYEKLTYVGTMSSGGHGSGSWCGPLSDHVRALHLLTLDENKQVVQFQIEPAAGISDPTKFAAANPNVELVQDDNMFHACTVGMGCLGVIYSATIETRAAYNIHETRTKYRWRDVAQRLPQLIADQGPGKRLHSIEVWVNPYLVDGDVWVVLGERAETSDAPRGERGLAIAYGGPEFLYRTIAWWVAHFPKATPALIDAAITATQAADVVMPAPQGLNFGAPNLAPVTATSCGVPSANLVPLVDALITWFQDRAQNTSSYITSPLGLRFVRAARAHLSPASDRDTCMIEVPILLGTPRARETLDGYQDFLFENYTGRPHWGQVNDTPRDRLEKMYPRLGAFLESYRVLNPKGFFDNAFTEQMGFRMR